jgi:hypothetical protein
MLSISTGHVNHHVTTESSNDANFGYYQWYSHMSHVLWNGMVEKSSTICSALLNDRFHRISLTLPRDFPLDQPEAMPEMIQLGKYFLVELFVSERSELTKKVSGRGQLG